ncbi:MAG: hypothetical protein M0Z88_09420 [Actinomycetota bacterium]|nr:hypothetical protein [Actinomycetota bacterium]
MLADPTEALRSWVGLLGAGGRLLLVEGRWWSGAGIPASEAVGMLGALGHGARLVPLAAIGARRSSISATCWSPRPPKRGRSGGGSRGREFGSFRVVIEHMFDKI